LTLLATQIVKNEAKPFEDLIDAHLGVGFIDSTEDFDRIPDTDSDTSEEQDEEQAERQSRVLDVLTSAKSNDLELPKTLQLIQLIIKSLYKLPTRRPAAVERIRDRLTSQFAPYQQSDIQFVRDLHPELDTAIAARLGQLVSLRRQILAYQERHNQKLQPKSTRYGLSSRLTVDTHQEAAGVDYTMAHTEQASEISRPSKATTYEHSPDGPEIQSFEYPPSITSSHHSKASSYAINSIDVSIPPRPKNADGVPHTFFLCPYCRIMQFIQTEKSWKKHVLRDLRPYVCTFSGCGLQDHFFENQNAWYLHETQEHRFSWHCNVEGHSTYNTQELFLDHISQSHSTKLSREQTTDLAPMFRRAVHNSTGGCNLCFRESKDLCNHVARHLERIALFALPRLSENDADLKLAQNAQSLEALLSHDGSLSASAKYESGDEVSVSQSTSKASDSDAEPAPAPVKDGEMPSDVPDNHVPDSEDVNWGAITTQLSKARKNDREPDASPESLLDQCFPDTLPQTKGVRFTEEDIQKIEDLLRWCSKDAWGRIPRIYIVLRLIGQLDAIEKFIEEEITDIWFPFHIRSLTKLLTGEIAQTLFLEVQEVVFNTQALNALSIERGEASHGHFSNESDIPLRFIGSLGRTFSGTIDRVSSTIDHKEYTLKTIGRPLHIPRNNHNAIRYFEMELRIMKRIWEGHHHIVNLVASKDICPPLSFVK